MVEKADFQNTLDVSLGTLDFSGLFMYKIAQVTKRKIDIYAAAGPSLWFHTAKQIDKTTEIVGPRDVTYLDGTTVKTFQDLDAENINTAGFGLLGGFNIRYELKDAYHFGWEFLYRIPFTDVSGRNDWSVSNLSANRWHFQRAITAVTFVKNNPNLRRNVKTTLILLGILSVALLCALQTDASAQGFFQYTYQINGLDKEINSSANDYAPTLSRDGNSSTSLRIERMAQLVRQIFLQHHALASTWGRVFNPNSALNSH